MIRLKRTCGESLKSRCRSESSSIGDNCSLTVRPLPQALGRQQFFQA